MTTSADPYEVSFLDINARQQSSVAAILSARLGKWDVITYRQLAEEVDAVASGLAGLGLGPGGALACACPDLVDVLIYSLAASRCGATTSRIGDLGTARPVQVTDVTVAVAASVRDLSRRELELGSFFDIGIALADEGAEHSMDERIVFARELMQPSAHVHPAHRRAAGGIVRRRSVQTHERVLLAGTSSQPSTDMAVMRGALRRGGTLVMPEFADDPFSSARQARPTVLYAPTAVLDRFVDDVAVRLGQTHGIRYLCARAWHRQMDRPAPGVWSKVLDGVIARPLRRRFGLDDARVVACGPPPSESTVRYFQLLAVEMTIQSGETLDTEA